MSTVRVRNAHTAGVRHLAPGAVDDLDETPGVQMLLDAGLFVRVDPSTPTTAAPPADAMHRDDDAAHLVPNDVVNARVRAATDDLRATFDRAWNERGEELSAARARIAELEAIITDAPNTSADDTASKRGKRAAER